MASCDKVDDIEEAYTGEDVTIGSLCFLPKLRIAVIILGKILNIYSFEVQNGGWCGQYDSHTKKYMIKDTEADYLVQYAVSKGFTETFINPWRDAGEMMVVDHSILSNCCLGQWYLEGKFNFKSSSGKFEEGERIYDDCF